MPNFFTNILQLNSDFDPRFENENSYRRIVFFNGIGAIIISPLFALGLYLTGSSILFVYLALSYSVGFVLYVILCWKIKELRDQLIYFLFFHLFVISFFAINELATSGFNYSDVVYALSFYILSSIIIQRLYPAVLYNIFIVLVLYYLYATSVKSEVPLVYIIPFFILFGVSSCLMIYARGRIVQSVKDYSQYLKKVMNNPGSGYFLFQLDSGLNVLDFNDEVRSYFTKKNINKKSLSSILNAYFEESDIENIKSLKTGNRIKKNIKIASFNESKELELNISVLPIRRKTFWLANITDVTQHKKERSELEISERKYRNLYHRNKAGVFTINSRSEILDGNDSFFKMFDNSLKKGDILFTNENESDWNFVIDLLSEKGNVHNYQTKIKLRNGGIKTFIFSWYIDEQTTLIEGSVIDLTNIQKASQALKQSEEKYRLIFEESNDVIILLNGDKIIDANKSTSDLFGIEISELKKMNLFDLSWDTSSSSEKKLLVKKQGLLNKRKIRFNWLFKRKGSDNTIEAEVALNEIILENKLFYQCVIHDQTEQNKLAKEKLRAEFAEETNVKLEAEIKERIKAEKKVQDQFLRTKAILDSSSNTFLLTLTLDKKISSFNYHCEQYFDEILGRPVQHGITFEDYFKDVLTASNLRLFNMQLNQVKNGESHQVEVAFLKNKKEQVWMEIFVNPIYDTDGRVSEISLVAHDISEKKKVSNEIIESLEEKKVLLKEIHHRVKNNLQVISSILNLQSSFIHDENTLNILQESRNRIRSMAIIHENLYKTEDFSSINFGEYLYNLTVNLLASYRISEEIVLNSEIDSVDLVLDQAIPCGLLVNEIISNSLKHAWREKENGVFTIKLSQSGNEVTLELSDDGIGLPDKFEKLQEETLGLQLVVTLIEQLDGTLKVAGENGTKYLIKFDNIKTLANVKN